MNDIPYRMQRVEQLCNNLHSKMDVWKGAFRPQLNMNDKQISKAYKQYVPKSTLDPKKESNGTKDNNKGND